MADLEQTISPEYTCPACEGIGMIVFHDVPAAPVHSVLQIATRAEAIDFPRRDIKLGLCPACGFISNVVFDPSVHNYSARYEETQGFSPTFNAFHRRLAEDLIARYDLHGKRVIEIGCGKGEFLNLLCEIGPNSGVGFDPAYIDERNQSAATSDITFIKDFYDERYAHYQGDFVCCKMTLEHIHDVGRFVATVRRSIGDQTDTVVFFQVPNMSYVLKDRAFWDIYYEHCSYFTPGALARLFRRHGFAVTNLWTDYDDQYLMIEARIAGPEPVAPLSFEDTPQDVARAVADFTAAVRTVHNQWRGLLDDVQASAKRAVIWGSGSKGVAFLTTIDHNNLIEYTVDINPYRHGMYMAGTGQQIVGPDFLRDYRPDLVIVMNPIYREEIGRDLAERGLMPEILTM